MNSRLITNILESVKNIACYRMLCFLTVTLFLFMSCSAQTTEVQFPDPEEWNNEKDIVDQISGARFFERSAVKYLDAENVEYTLSAEAGGTEEIAYLLYNRKGDIVTIRNYDTEKDPLWHTAQIYVNAQGRILKNIGRSRNGFDFSKFFPIFPLFPTGQKYTTSCNLIINELIPFECLNTVDRVGSNKLRIYSIFRALKPLENKVHLERTAIFDSEKGILLRADVLMRVFDSESENNEDVSPSLIVRMKLERMKLERMDNPNIKDYSSSYR